MRQKPGTRKSHGEKVVKDIRRATRKQYSAEEKIRIVLDGLMRRIRCAIYTRKSTEEGLEQDFNSLDAQREACEAYIASQKHEGWELLPDHYDDGGISGGHLDRPALQRLMQAVDEKRVDQIVVYKIDRLTRSLGELSIAVISTTS